MTLDTEHLPRISILARMVAALPCWSVMLGAACAAISIKGAVEGMRNAESAGIAAVASGMAGANLALVIALYVAIFLMMIAVVVAVIRNFVVIKTVSPSAWFFVVIGTMAIVPLALIWEGDSLLMGALMSRGNVALIAPNVRICLILTLATAGLFSLIVLAVSVIPLRPFMRAKRKWAGVVVLVLMEIVLIGLAAGFQLHMAWLQRVGLRQSL